ncbi:MAG: hypothetical protein M3Q83_03915 [Pseudomonadota bacterium]|nr:hypothetical protein [Pseudomonadota bacterium]
MKQAAKSNIGSNFRTVINARLTGRWNGTTVDFTCDFDPPWDASKNGDVELPPKSGPHHFKFHLHDPDKIDLEFLQDTAVLDVDESGSCPPQSGIHSDQIRDITSNGNLATFIDENSDDQRLLAYALKVTSKYGNTKFDPIIRNGGGF